MNEKDAGKESQSLQPVSECGQASPPETPSLQAPRPASGTAKPAGARLGVGTQRPDQRKPLRKERRSPWSGEPTVLEGGGDDFLRRRPRPGPVARLHHQAVLGELVEVVQRVDLTVPGGVDTDDVELEVAPGAVLAVAYLVSSDNAVLQMLLGSLNRRVKNALKNTRQGETSTYTLVRGPKIRPKNHRKKNRMA